MLDVQWCILIVTWIFLLYPITKTLTWKSEPVVRGDNAGCTLMHTHSYMMQCWILLLYLIIKTLTWKSEPVVLKCWILLLYLIIKTLTWKSEPVMLDALVRADNAGCAMMNTHSHMMQSPEWTSILAITAYNTSKENSFYASHSVPSGRKQ